MDKRVGNPGGLLCLDRMGIPSALRTPSSREAWLALAVFAACLGFHFRGALVGWQSRNLPGVEYRQAQTAISAFYINQEDNFSLAYPTPVLGKPWSIPLEFPLYQWTVVSVSRVTGLSLTKAGRAVSLACFTYAGGFIKHSSIKKLRSASVCEALTSILWPGVSVGWTF